MDDIKLLRKIAKYLHIRLTINRQNSRIYKKNDTLKKQIINKIRHFNKYHFGVKQKKEEDEILKKFSNMNIHKPKHRKREKEISNKNKEILYKMAEDYIKDQYEMNESDSDSELEEFATLLEYSLIENQQKKQLKKLRKHQRKEELKYDRYMSKYAQEHPQLIHNINEPMTHQQHQLYRSVTLNWLKDLGIKTHKKAEKAINESSSIEEMIINLNKLHIKKTDMEKLYDELEKLNI